MGARTSSRAVTGACEIPGPRINEKLGFKPAGQRSMMKGLPKTLAERNRITSATCPHCGRTGARASQTKPGKLYFHCCNLIADLPA
jgi:hypothetical protein